MENVLEKIARLNEIGIALSAADDHEQLCDQILAGAMELTDADGGSLYQLSDDRQSLEFSIVLTHSLDIHMGGSSGHAISFPAVPLFVNDEPNMANVVSACVHDESTINIADAYHAEGFDFSGTRRFDRQTGYRTRSILTVPLKDHHNEIIGVLQLINATDGGGIREFSHADRQLAESLASQAAVAMSNKRLIDEQRELFDAFIKLMADAIDEKSPYTGGHCKRVPALTMMIADACEKAEKGELKGFSMTDSDRYELGIAGWLHDVGKVTTPEYVVDKATKLETIYDRIDAIETRFEVIRRDAIIDALQDRIERLQEALNNEPDTDYPDIDEQLEQTLAQLEADRDFIRRCNIGGEYMDEAQQQRVREIACYRWNNPHGVCAPLLSDDEISNLTVAKGTLTEEERQIINNHMAVTIKMLERLPFPRHLARVPEYAGAHHERMDGTGYPRGLTREQMSLPARMMAVADIFEALSASDRPYKTGKPLSECLRILGLMKLDNHIDPDIFDAFIRYKVYLRYAEKFLPKCQIDEVDHAMIPGYEE